MHNTKAMLAMLWKLSGEIRKPRELETITIAIGDECVRIDLELLHLEIYGTLELDESSTLYAITVMQEGISPERAREILDECRELA